MKQRILTAILIVLLVLPPLILGGLALDLLVAAFALVAVYEITTLIDKKVPWYGIGVLYLVAMVLARCQDIHYPMFLGLFMIGLFVIDIFTKEMGISKISYLFLMTLLFSTAVRGLFSINNMLGSLGLIYVILVTYVGDSGAYFIGSLFGKRKLIPRVSPNKTVEGAIGGFVLAFIVSMVFAFYLLELSIPVIIIASVLLPIMGQIGDLAFSSIKRHFKQKDFGSIFPGHGGMLDRIDSLLFNFIVLNSIIIVNIYLYIVFIGS